MLRLTKKLIFAIDAVVDIAYNASDAPVQSKEIAQRQGIPRRYLEQVLQQLVHHNVLAGQRGPKGGYRLARERRRISVGEIIRIVRKLEGTADPAAEPDGSELGVKVLRPIWIDMQLQMMERFDNMTIEELCERAREKGITSEARQITDFTI